MNGIHKGMRATDIVLVKPDRPYRVHSYHHGYSSHSHQSA